MAGGAPSLSHTSKACSKLTWSKHFSTSIFAPKTWFSLSKLSWSSSCTDVELRPLSPPTSAGCAHKSIHPVSCWMSALIPIRQASAATLIGRNPISLGMRTQRTAAHGSGKIPILRTKFHSWANASKNPWGASARHRQPIRQALLLCLRSFLFAWRGCPPWGRCQGKGSLR